MRKFIAVFAVTLAALAGTVTSASAATTGETVTTFAVSADSSGLAITVPVSKNLGSGAPGSSISTTLGAVTVSDTRALLLGNWTASVSATDFSHATVTGANGTIGAANVSYSPGTASASSGLPAAGAGGSLEQSRTAFSRTGVGNSSATWDPTVTVSVPAQAVGGTYSGTITHSVA